MGIISEVLIFMRLLKYRSTATPSHIPQDDIDHQKDLPLKDRISELPDDVFAIIFSHIPLKEVTRTCVISHRWRNLWKVTPRLDMDNFRNAGLAMVNNTQKLNYVYWVNEIIESHEGGELQVFKIRYELDKHFDLDIDRWVKFAFTRQVQNFGLEVSRSGSMYTLTSELFQSSMNQKNNGFRYLKSLSLKHVNISDKHLEFIMNNSPVLERLSIKCSPSLSTFRLCGSQYALKFLEVHYGLKSLEIYDVPSLVSLSYSGTVPQKMIIENVSSLTDFCFGGKMIYALFKRKLNDLLAQFSRSLKSLTLDLSYYAPDFKNYDLLPKMTAVEKLVLHTSDSSQNTSTYACLTYMFPFLKEFVFQGHSHNDAIRHYHRAETFNDRPHHFLKKVKILGYFGSIRDVKIALYLIKNAVALETIVIDPHDQCPIFYRIPPNAELERDARIRAYKQLKGKVPSRVKLVIL